ncbi:hypothetical protein RSOLAG22IIIB_08259 [Rhizoctonia solani]|uniref:Coilin n=1 Tax=Rhizoctonia solani TaxID=456999 RepID=A0A0K6FSF5_9AGAM|nr:hypothetical protein RSOLAG22IIIB_08259 [Rhizoctonia solani]
MNSTFTRFRVQTALPLEPIKVWHAISPELNIKTIEDLTENISQALGLAEVDDEIFLELDGFSLLPSSPVGVVRDGDMVTVRCKSRPDKRKATEDRVTKKQKTQSPVPTSSPALAPPASSVKQLSKSPATFEAGPSRQASTTKPVTEPSKDVSSSSEDDSTTDSDSSSEEDSDSSSESTTDSDSDSSSGSESESDAGPTPQPISRQLVLSARQPSVSQVSVAPSSARVTPSQPPVPPGQGKSSTKNRNARRRALRKHVAAGTAFSPQLTPTPASATATPAPDFESLVATQVKASTPIALAKSANKNKRKGFDKDMADAVATRITYGTPAPAPISAAHSPRTDSPAFPIATTKSRYTHYHVVPPSQLKDLPSNVIVSSVDVEAADGLEDVGEWFDGENHAAEEDLTAANVNSPPASNNKSKKIDWEVVDSQWEQSWGSFPTIDQARWDKLQPGTLLAYLGLAIDPVTCTPGTKVHLARVVSGPSDGGQAECFFIERPGAGDIGFGFGGKFGAAPEAEDDAGDEEPGETRGVAFAEVKDWKMIP